MMSANDAAKWNDSDHLKWKDHYKHIFIKVLFKFEEQIFLLNDIEN